MINQEEALKVIRILKNYYGNTNDLAKVNYPNNIEYGSNEYFIYIFYSCMLDYGMRSNVYHNNLINTYLKYPELFNPNYIKDNYELKKDELKEILKNNIHVRYPSVASSKWIKLSNYLVSIQVNILSDLKNINNYNDLDRYVRNTKCFGQKTGGLLIRLIYETNVGNFIDDMKNIPIDRHDIEISYLTGVIDSDSISNELIKELGSLWVMVANSESISSSNIDKYLWAVGNDFCNKKDCLNCPLSNLCHKNEK